MFGVLVLFLLMCQPRLSMEEVKILAPLSTTSQSGRIDFTNKHKATPKVFAWARPHDGRRYRRYKTVVDQVDTRGFHYTITRTDNPHGTIHTAIWLYWITSHPELTEKSKTFGDEWKGKTLDIPHVTWFSTPSISKTSHNKFTVLGRKILISQVHKMLQNLVKREITQTPSNEFRIELTIKGDIIYMDDDVNFQGLKKLEINARKLISNGNTLTLTAPTDSTKLTDGKNGKSGSDSPEVDVYLHELLGNIKVITRASNGKVGQNGKDGVNGEDRKWKSPPLKKAAVCKNFYTSHSDKRYLFIDNPGPNGGPGGNGEKAGLSGNGGTASRVNLYIVNSTGQFSLNQFSGKGGNPAQHGYGGKGGQGGPGGCGVICGDSEICQYGFMYPSCYSVGNPCADPVHGENGHPGLDGFVVFPLPEWGRDGIVGGGYFTEVANVKKWFTNDTDLLQVIQRRGESLFLRNKKSEALEDFEFIESVTDEDSDMYQRASYLSNAIAQGFDYYGNDKEYAPDLDWFYLRKRVMTSLEAGKSFEDAYNQVKNKIELVDEVQGALRSIVTISNQKIESQLAFENNELENQKLLYVRALKVLEHRMITSTKQIETLVQDIINEKVKAIPREKITTVLGAIVGFVVKLRKEEIPAALANIWTIVDTITSKNHCKLPTIKQALASAKERLTFGVNYEYVGPEKIDFTKMDVSAVPVIMKSDLGKNKGQLVQEFSCILGSNKSPEEQRLNGLIETFFRDGGLRINQIDLLLNINIKLQNQRNQMKIINESQGAVDAHFESVESSTAMSVKMQFTDLIFSLFQQQEAAIMSDLYQLSKAYQFITLWDFDIMSKYINNFGDRVMTTQLGSLNGMFQLQNIYQNLENERNSFLKYVESTAGPASHTFNAVWKLDTKSHPYVLQSLHNNGYFTFHIELDPNNVTIDECVNCYNARLMAMYVQLSGSPQDEEVPPTVYVRVAHLGDSSFLLPAEGGAGNKVVRLQQTPVNVSGGKIMSFNANEEIRFKNDPNLMQIFKKTENEFCKHSSSPTDFFGGKPCKSPYATYTVVVPKGNHTCSLDPNNWIDGSNCRRLNLTRFDTILVFARVQSWSNYRSRDDFIGITTNLELTNRNCGHPCSTVSLDILWFVIMSLWVSFMFLNDDV